MINANEYETKSLNINAQKVLDNKELQVTLEVIGVVVEEMRDGKNKLVLCFDGTDQTLILNQTNLKTMKTAKGNIADTWKGAQIKLTVVPTVFNGQPTKSVLISSVV
jgi:hypothetical protein